MGNYKNYTGAWYKKSYRETLELIRLLRILDQYDENKRHSFIRKTTQQ